MSLFCILLMLRISLPINAASTSKISESCNAIERTEVMDKWCNENCNGIPKFCPQLYCQCHSDSMTDPFANILNSTFIHNPVDKLLQSIRNTSNVEFIDASTGKKYCLTKGCVNTASDLVRNMDESVDPCTDFYQFACGGFIKETIIPEHKEYVSSFSKLEDKLNARLLKIFEGKSKKMEPTIFNSVRDFYKSCKNETQIEQSSKDELKHLFLNLGGWPVVEGEKWTEDGFKWYVLAQKSLMVGFDVNLDTMLTISMEVDSKDSTKRIFTLDQPRFGLAREFLIKGEDDNVVQAYYQYMVETAVWMGASPPVAAKEMKEVIDFELILAKMALPQEERRNTTALYNPMTIEQVSQIYPDIPWVNLINIILNNSKISVDTDEIVNVAVPKFIKEFQKLILTIPARVQANYIFWRNAMFAMSYLDSKANTITLKYRKVLMGKASKKPRWEKCVESIAFDTYWFEGDLANAIGSMFIRNYFSKPVKDLADNMVTNILNEFKLMLDELTWMDPQTKINALQKADLITSHVAYPEEILNSQLLNDFYRGLVLNKNGYLNNALTLHIFIRSYNGRQYRIPIDKHSWKFNGRVAIIDALYFDSENSIKFPAAILDGIFFGAERPLYMNYGAIGLGIGHEITHGFDDTGSQKDGNGNLVDWWEPKAKEKYLKKTECVIEQYSNYTVEVEGEMLNINGINTQGENIADMGGVKQAFRAYNRVVAENGPEPLLPGLNYTQRQLFWLSSGQIWCSVRRPANLKYEVLTDTHSPSKFRVNGPLANMPEFAQDWGCPVRSMMNPTKRCTVW